MMTAEQSKRLEQAIDEAVMAHEAATLVQKEAHRVLQTLIRLRYELL